jgi:multiple sugar transport system permease protein
MGIGFCMVLYLAALQNIPVSYYEAAELDGTTELGKFIHITLPLLSSTTFMLFITRLITSFEVFGIISVMTGGGPVKSTTVLVYEIYIQSFQYYKFGYASAIAWLLFFIIFTVTVLQWVGQKKWVHE